MTEPDVEDPPHHSMLTNKGGRKKQARSKQSCINNICLYSHDLRSGSCLIHLITAEWDALQRSQFSHLPVFEFTDSLWAGAIQHHCTFGEFACVCLRQANCGINHLHLRTHFNTKIFHWDGERYWVLSPSGTLLSPNNSPQLLHPLWWWKVRISGGSVKENRGQACTGELKRP